MALTLCFLVPFLLVEGAGQCFNNLYQFCGVVFLRGFFGQNPPFGIAGRVVVCLWPRLATWGMRHVVLRQNIRSMPPIMMYGTERTDEKVSRSDRGVGVLRRDSDAAAKNTDLRAFSV